MLKLATKISFKNLILFRKIAFTPPRSYHRHCAVGCASPFELSCLHYPHG